MGGTTFETYGQGTDAKAIFDQLRNAAAYEYGHGGYTGSIAEKRGFVVIDDFVHSYDEAVALANRLIDEGDERIDSKWGPAGAIKISEPTNARTATETRSLKLKFVTIDYTSQPHVIASAEAAKRAKSTEFVKAVNVINDDRQYTVKAHATPGKTKTVYFVPGLGREFSTQAAARAAMVEHMRNITPPLYNTQPMSVQCKTVREDGRVLVIGEWEPKRRTIEAEATYAVKPAADKHWGWLFFGWASC